MKAYFPSAKEKSLITRNRGLALLGTESEVIAMKNLLEKVLALLKIALICLLLALLALLTK